MTTAVLLLVLAAELAGTALGYPFLWTALDLLASLVKAWREPGGLGAVAFGGPFVLLFCVLLIAVFLALALGATAAAATLGRLLLRWRGLALGRRDVVYLGLLICAANVGLFLGLAWLEPVTMLPPLLRQREYALGLAGFLGLVAIVSALIADTLLRPSPTACRPLSDPD